MCQDLESHVSSALLYVRDVILFHYIRVESDHIQVVSGNVLHGQVAVWNAVLRLDDIAEETVRI